mgnify:CR=1 FL=1
MATLPQTKVIKKRDTKTRIKRNPNSTESAHYFTMATQEHIVQYQAEGDAKIKEDIYVKHILPAFDTLVENLINVYGFRVQYESREDLKMECLEFLYTTLPKFKADKGSKAFSYFNVVSRNWLTVKSKQNTKRLHQHVSLDDVENISPVDLEKIESYNTIPSYDEMSSQAEIHLFLTKLMEELTLKVKTPNEQVTLDAIKEVIDNLEDLEFLSKRAVLLYVREISGLTSKNLSMALATLKKHYREFKTTEQNSYV